jgi:hypothetical protein
MEAFAVAFVTLLLIVLVLLLPSAITRRAAIKHGQSLAAMEEISDEAKERITQLHQAYRAELTRAAKAQAAKRRAR